MAEAVVRRLDGQGRVSVPAEWRRDWKSDSVMLRKRGNMIEMLPVEPVKPSEFFDSIRVPDAADFLDAHSLKRALLGPKR